MSGKKLFSFTFMPGIIPMKCCQYPFIYLDELPLFTFFYKPSHFPIYLKYEMTVLKEFLNIPPLGGTGELGGVPRKSPVLYLPC